MVNLTRKTCGIPTARIDLQLTLVLISQLGEASCKGVRECHAILYSHWGGRMSWSWIPEFSQHIYLFSATLVEQGSVLDHSHRTGEYRGSCTVMPAMIG